MVQEPSETKSKQYKCASKAPWVATYGVVLMLVLACCLAKKNKVMLIQNMMTIFLHSSLSGDIKKLLAAAAAAAHIHTFTHTMYKKINTITELV